MGAADVVPGVSGGTMAFILGIYGRLLGAIKAFDIGLLGLAGRGRWRQAAGHVDLKFLLPLVAGIACALWFFTRIIPLPALIRTHPEPVYGLFFGLISASIVILALSPPGWRNSHRCLAVLGAGFGFALVNLVPVSTPDSGWFLFLCGAVAISAMLLPGISGSFILLILKKYAYVFGAIGRLDFTVLVPFALGAVVGLLLFSRLVDWLLKRFYRGTLAAITGILTGSLWVIWPFQERSFELREGKRHLLSSTPVWPVQWDSLAIFSLLLAGLGGALVWLLHRLAAHRRDG